VVFVPGTGAKRRYWRINIEYRSELRNAGATTNWLYFRITN
jgi:hypothetical protein